jgi:hypothetical protein
MPAGVFLPMACTLGGVLATGSLVGTGHGLGSVLWKMWRGCVVARIAVIFWCAPLLPGSKNKAKQERVS